MTVRTIEIQMHGWGPFTLSVVQGGVESSNAGPFKNRAKLRKKVNALSKSLTRQFPTHCVVINDLTEGAL